MRTVVLAEELMGLILKFTRKSANMGSLCVSWDVHGQEKIQRRQNLTRKVQIVLFLCGGLLTILTTILFFLLYRLDSNVVMQRQPWQSLPRIRPSSRTPWFVHHISSKASSIQESKSDVEDSVALQGLGILFRKGTKSMNELVVAHLSDNVRVDEFRLFLRTLHRSGVSVRADIIFLFPWSPMPLQMHQVIQEEEVYFQKILEVLTARVPLVAEEKKTDDDILRMSSNSSFSRFNFLAFSVSSADRRKNLSYSPAAASDFESAVYPLRQEWGSVSGYEMAELDPSDILAAFFEMPSADLKRWFCYQILLGMLKQQYKHVLLTEVGKVLILGDVFSAVRKSSALYLTTEDRTWVGDAEDPKHLDASQNLSAAVGTSLLESHGHPKANQSKQTSGNSTRDSQPIEVASETFQKIDDMMVGLVDRRKILVAENKKIISKQKKVIPEKSIKGGTKGLIESIYGSKMWSSLETEDKQNKLLVSNIMLGAMRPIRALVNVMATEIVRVALQRRKRDSFSDQAPLNYLIYKGSYLGRKINDHILIVSNKESVIHAVSGSNQRYVFQRESCGEMYAAITNFPNDALEQFGGLNIPAVITQDICSSPIESIVYKDCTCQKPGG